MTESIYRALANHLDTLPGGFASSETGADLRLLEALFEPKEAVLAVHLRVEREAAEAIAERAGIAVPEAQRRLDQMALKGLIFSVQPDDGPSLYTAAPWVVGIWEFQVNRMDAAFVELVDDYHRTRERRPRGRTIPQMRTIPVSESIEPRLEALPYEAVNALIDAHDRFAVAPCICRRNATLHGNGCDAPEESCLVFGEFADFYVRGGRGRAIDRAEVTQILANADAHNLVLQPTNSQEIGAICCCCGCCCGVLKSLKRHDKPAEVVASSFIANLDAEACVGCWTCVDRCQMEALREDGDRVALNSDRCIGCGLCVTTCPSGALTLQRKPGSERLTLPDTMQHTWQQIYREQGPPQ